MRGDSASEDDILGAVSMVRIEIKKENTNRFETFELSVSRI